LEKGVKGKKMASSLSSLSTTAIQRASDLLAGLSKPVQTAIYNPLVQKAIGTIVFLRLFRSFNRVLSGYVLNNFASDKWDWPNELVLLSGGCSGIGKQVALDLSRNGVKVIIVDIQEPKFPLRMSLFYSPFCLLYLSPPPQLFHYLPSFVELCSTQSSLIEA
jgi:hypothetical protein